MNNDLITNEQLLNQLNWRYAVKRFDPSKKISAEDWEALEDVLVLSPSSYGLQPWKFYVVTDAGVRTELRKQSWDQSQISDSSHLVVIAGRMDSTPKDIEEYLERVTEVRGTPAKELEILKGMMLSSQRNAVETGFINEWSARQCFIALGFLLTAAALRGIDSCPMEGFVSEEYDRILGIRDEGYFSVVVCALGYRDREEDFLTGLAKVRFPKDKILKRI